MIVGNFNLLGIEEDQDHLVAMNSVLFIISAFIFVI